MVCPKLACLGTGKVPEDPIHAVVSLVDDKEAVAENVAATAGLAFSSEDLLGSSQRPTANNDRR